MSQGTTTAVTHSECPSCAGAAALVFDESGQLVEDTSDRRVPFAPRPCSLSTLKGAWMFALSPRPPIPGLVPPEIRGPMRIEVSGSALRISGDVYVRHVGVAGDRDLGVRQPLPEPSTESSGDGAPPVSWYPQLPMNQYSWYFRSTGVTYAAGQLRFGFVRHLWDRTTQKFITTDTGDMILRCSRALVPQGGPALMTGTTTIGGRTYDINATKTSDLYRGCRIEVDAMTNRVWPASATVGGGVVTTFQQIYASAGWDVTVAVDEVNVPEDASLTNAELQTLLATHRGLGLPDAWRLWLLVGSSQGGLFGIMFDDDAVPREGSVGFADATLGNSAIIEAGARNRPLDEVPAAFLRTLVHEAGHALNLFHPKHDVHAPPIGTEIMNQTGDVMGFATVTNPYPRNATFAFAEHDRLSLIHSPDPQVRPGWKPFGWGHGSLSAGLPVPADAMGLVNADDAEGLLLELQLPPEVFVGEYAVAVVVLTNTGDAPREVTTRFNLAEGDLRLLHVLPDGAVEQVRDVVLACGPRPTTTLAPGAAISARMQVFFTSEGVTFDQPGTHRLRAELDIDEFTAVRSARVTVHVRSAASDAEREIAATTLDHGVGMAIAIGDFGQDEDTRQRLETLAVANHESDTGAACAVVLANSLARAHTDYRSESTRAAEPDESKRFLDLAVQGRSAEKVLVLAATVASPVEKDAPVVADALARIGRARKPKADMERAQAIAEDFAAPTARSADDLP
ncbi:MAG TPA: hypothetical protein VIW24_05725 [Aldersonia sp.]